MKKPRTWEPPDTIPFRLKDAFLDFIESLKKLEPEPVAVCVVPDRDTLPKSGSVTLFRAESKREDSFLGGVSLRARNTLSSSRG